MTYPDYAELHTVSNFSFLRGASHPEELVLRAAELGYRAIAITDECSVAGVVRAHSVARDQKIKLIIGSEFRLDDHSRLVLLAPHRRAYGQLCALITQARRNAPKGEYKIEDEVLAQQSADCLALLVHDGRPDAQRIAWFAAGFRGRGWLAASWLFRGQDSLYCQLLMEHSESFGLPIVATGDVHMHERARRPLRDVLTAIRIGTPVQQAGHALFASGEQCLRSRQMLSRLYPPEWLQQSIAIAARCDFSLDSLRYEYPEEIVPRGETASAYLRRLTEAGMQQRWPHGVTQKVRALVEHELQLIAELQYEAYFLTVYDIVKFARSRNILCQGRGSAANSAVCYCLGITEVDPARMEMLFERFISKERNEPPDIDVDFEHERREEVFQYIYNKYTRERAALAATVITYRPRSAIRDVGKALGLGLDQVDRLAKNLQWWDRKQTDIDERLREVGFDPGNPVIKKMLLLVNEILGFPRHLSQHVGGFVISRGPLSQLVPVENAAMPDRTVIQWDKDDLDALGLLKVDCLALGMLSAIHRCLDLVADFYDKPFSMADIPAEDPGVYELIQHADTVGVFQIESRAQMSMLPRLRPACFYDLVIEVAIVRPGPIQGDMVHPYLRRRQGLEAVTYPSEAVRSVLARTLGVPIFQEQVIKLAMVAAGFTPGEADRLRRSMAAWKRRGGLEEWEQRLIKGMDERGYSTQFAKQIFQQILGFGDYGFPESHAASFALLAYVSAWLKRYEPAAFCCALINSQPMGFYAPAQLVQDAQRHGVRVRPVDVRFSIWDCTLEPEQPGATASKPVLRLGLRMVKGLSREGADRVLLARDQMNKRSDSVEAWMKQARLNRKDQQALADADALRGLTGHRYRARWAVMGMEPELPVLQQTEIREADPMLRAPSEGQDIVGDYATLGLTLRRHPLALLRAKLRQHGMVTAADITGMDHGRHVRVAGLVISRQRPGTATGVIFATLEDETGSLNIVVWSRIAERFRQALLRSRLLGVSGELQREGEVIHIIAHGLRDYSEYLGELQIGSRDFH